MSKGVRRLLIGLAVLVLFGIVAALILPMFAKARSPHRTISCANNLKQVGLGLKMWAGDHGEVYPNKVEECSRYLGNQAALLMCPRSGNKPAASRITDNVGTWSDYTYVPGLPESVPPDTVLMYCHPKNHDGEGANILFTDGHVEWFNSKGNASGETSFEDMMKKVREQREQ